MSKDLTAIYQKYADVAEIFTLPQWQAICLVYGEELSQEEAAKKLGINRRTVSSRLRRAYAKLDAHQKKLREEQFRKFRREIEED